MSGELDLVEPSTVGLNRERLRRVADYVKGSSCFGEPSD